MCNKFGAWGGQWISIEIKRAIDMGFYWDLRSEKELAEKIYSGGGLEE